MSIPVRCTTGILVRVKYVTSDWSNSKLADSKLAKNLWCDEMKRQNFDGRDSLDNAPNRKYNFAHQYTLYTHLLFTVPG